MRIKLRRFIEMRYLKRLPTMAVLVLILMISCAIGYAWILYAFPSVANVANLDPEKWAALEGLTSVAAFALAVGAGFMVLIEMAERTDSRNLDIYRDIYERLMSVEQIEARRYIYQNIPDSDDKQVMVNAILKNDAARKHVKLVLNSLDYFGFLVDQDWVTADEVIGWLSPIVVKVWVKIGPLVEHECAKRPEEPDYYEAARKLAKKCFHWRGKNLKSREADITFDDERL